MCTNEGDQTGPFPVFFGEMYTVTRIVEGWEVADTKDRTFYELEERPSDYAYWTGLFSPLSEIEETELVTEEVYA